MVAQPSHGAVILNANGSFTYAPSAEYSGTDSFTYRVWDGTVWSAAVPVTINVTPVNDPPVVSPDGAIPSQVAKLLAADGEADDSLGRSFAISGDTMVVGVPMTTSARTHTKARSRVFTRSGTTWTPQADAHRR